MKFFSHIYIEQDAYQYPVTKHILESVRYNQIITIKDYKNIFNRSNQNFQIQKKSPKLILAIKKDNFLYKGSEMSDDFGYSNFYYNTTIQNCIYNCDYCYLQGMFDSANLVIYVNIEDFLEKTRKALKEGTVFLCISYDTDLLALESVVPYTAKWIEFATNMKNLLIEIRTKSNGFSYIQNIEPIPNAILAWTLSPEEVVRKYEKRTPSLKVRIRNILSAIEKGWRVRICFDPVVYIHNWKEIYSEAIDTVFSEIPSDKLEDVTLGVFRVNTSYLKKMKKQNSSPLLYFPFRTDKTIKTYSSELENNMLDFLSNKISNYYQKEKIRCFKESL